MTNRQRKYFGDIVKTERIVEADENLVIDDEPYEPKKRKRMSNKQYGELKRELMRRGII